MEGDRKGVPGQLVLITREDQQMARRLVHVTAGGLINMAKYVMKTSIHHNNSGNKK